MQLIGLLRDILPEPLWLRPYRILSTGPKSGLIEAVCDTQSLHALKRHRDFVSLRAHFEAHYGGPSSSAFATAQHNFVASLAAYSVVCYLLAIKDRHNGNLLIDRQGHLIHIDFGFVLGKAPGGACALEASVPFKLTREMVDVLGGLHSPLFKETFVDLCVSAFRAASSHADTLLTLIEMSAFRSELPCFQGAPRATEQLLAQVRGRLMIGASDAELRARVQQLIATSYNSVLTRGYDEFQKWSNGICD